MTFRDGQDHAGQEPDEVGGRRWAYVVGPELIRMAVAVVRDLDIRSIAQPVMHEMVDAQEAKTRWP